MLRVFAAESRYNFGSITNF